MKAYTQIPQFDYKIKSHNISVAQPWIRKSLSYMYVVQWIIGHVEIVHQWTNIDGGKNKLIILDMIDEIEHKLFLSKLTWLQVLTVEIKMIKKLKNE